MLLIENIEQVREHFPLTKTFEFAAVKPSLELAQQSYINDLLGPDFLAEVKDFYNAPTTAEQTELVKQLGSAIVNLGLLHFFPKNNVVVGNNGIQMTRSENMVAAFPWQVKQLLDQVYTDGYLSINNLLTLLENNPTAFPVWHTKIYGAYKKLFLRSAIEFNNYHNINRDRALYFEISPLIIRLEEDYILPVVGKELFDDLKADLAKVEYQYIIKPIRYALAHLTIAEAIVQSFVRFTNKGLVVNKGNTNGDNPDLYDQPKPQIMDAMVRNANKVAHAHLDTLKGLLNKAAAAGDLDIFKNSDAYLPDDEAKPEVSDYGYPAI